MGRISPPFMIEHNNRIAFVGMNYLGVFATEQANSGSWPQRPRKDDTPMRSEEVLSLQDIDDLFAHEEFE